ncbi:MAG: NAD(P)H-hydrate epimerase, partial [Shewanella sp.]
MAQDLSHFPDTLYTQAQVRAAELYAASQGALSLYELVERAGAAAFDCLVKHHPEASMILVLAGSGNNGADALVCAHLARARGIDVSVMIVSAARTPECQQALAHYLADGGKLLPLGIEVIFAAKIIVDGLLGTGVYDAVRDDMAKYIRAINHSSAWVLSLDLPSGVVADTGAVVGVAV